MTKHFEFESFLVDFEKRGKALYGEKYTIAKCDLLVLQKLLVYFDCNAEQATQFEIEFAKGIYINGQIGVGKTSTMCIFREFLLPEHKFITKACREVAFEFIQGGPEIISKYTNRFGFNSKKLRDYCFDDLGLESKSKFFGNNVNVMREIILSRYDLFITKGIITHFTSNLSANGIMEMYGNEVRSRIREMCNIITFDSSVPDNRK
jgi:DNA replication protein DnaC